MMTELTKHQTEKVGTAYVALQLYREGLMFARPDIDRGIDLIVYEQSDAIFRAVPLQLKAFSGEAFYTDQKYLRIPNLIIVYLWHVGKDQPIRAFGMPYDNAEYIVDEHHWSRKNGVYAYTRGSSVLEAALTPFEITSWRRLIFEALYTEQNLARDGLKPRP